MQHLIEKYKVRVEGHRHTLRALTANLNDEKVAMEETERKLDNVSMAVNIVDACAGVLKTQIEVQLSDVVTRCLQTIFGDHLRFRVTIESNASGRSEAKMVLIQEGEEIDPLDAAGGGLVDVIAFALRIGCMLLQCPEPCRYLILDEPFKYLSRDLQPEIGKLLQELSEQLNFRYIIVTHEDDLGL